MYAPTAVVFTSRVSFVSGFVALTEALGIDLRWDGVNLVGRGDLWLAEDGHDGGPIVVSPRIGISKAADLPLRFFLHGNVHVSGPNRQHQ